MYPLTTTAPYPKNQWYIAAFADEVSRAPMHRTILGKPVVLFRTESGDVVALGGLCPHRMMPLWEGELIGDNIRCAYHGLTFDQAGQCIAGMGEGPAPAKMRTPAYPVVERWQWIWIWTGDSDFANPSDIPDHDALGLGSPDWTSQTNGYYHLDSRYLLLLDNLFDLTHVNFIHANSIGATMVMLEAGKLTEKDGIIRYSRERGGVELSDFHKRFSFPGYEGTVTQGFSSEYYGPGFVNAMTYWKPEAVNDDREYLGAINFVHGVTPETATTTHYFSAVSRSFSLENDQLTQALCANDKKVRGEDKVALDAIERQLELIKDPSGEVSLPADAGGIRVRRLLTQQIEAELAA